ncbi:protein Aster-C [Drosophila navojoa]|uniref:protein Aster-C n=1 Tax=Drosophila navojoa TaxID=7232 RepID=UPI0008472E44|nr:protein Aster-C [Drosophila navojoa]
MQSIYYNLKNGLQDLRPQKQIVTRQSAAIRTDVKRNSKGDNVPSSHLPKLATLYNKRPSDNNKKLLIWSTADKNREIRKSKNIRAASTVVPRGKSVIIQSHDRKSKSRVSHVKPTKTRAEPKMKAPDLTSGTIKTCDSDHEGRLIMKENFRLHVDKMFNLLFSSTSTFFSEFHNKRNTTDLCIGPWKNGKAGEQVRTVNLTVALQANVGPKTSKVSEYQTLRACSTPGQLYSIDVCLRDELQQEVSKKEHK